MNKLAVPTTMLRLLSTIQQWTTDERTVLATATALVNGDQVLLCGNFLGQKIDSTSDLNLHRDRGLEAQVLEELKRVTNFIY